MRDTGPFVLIVDAYPDAAESTRDVLALYGVRARTAASFDEAAAVARRERPAVVVTDTLLPDGDGCKLAELLHTTISPRPAVFAIGSMPRADADPFTGWFMKPADPEQLADAVRRVLQLPVSVGQAV